MKLKITSDNLRSEDPQTILKEIEAGLLEAGAVGGKHELVEDRKAAIARAVAAAGSGDVVLIAGKGHETVQILKDRTIRFDDREAAREAIRQRMTS